MINTLIWQVGVYGYETEELLKKVLERMKGNFNTGDGRAWWSDLKERSYPGTI